jgi:hypothetical protein
MSDTPSWLSDDNTSDVAESLAKNPHVQKAAKSVSLSLSLLVPLHVAHCFRTAFTPEIKAQFGRILRGVGSAELGRHVHVVLRLLTEVVLLAPQQ